MKIYNEISFFEFQERFQSEEDCFQYLKKLRWRYGFHCPRCGHTKAYFTKTRKVFQCISCRHQTSVTAHTIFHRTHVPLNGSGQSFWSVPTSGGVPPNDLKS